MKCGNLICDSLCEMFAIYTYIYYVCLEECINSSLLLFCCCIYFVWFKSDSVFERLNIVIYVRCVFMHMRDGMGWAQMIVYIVYTHIYICLEDTHRVNASYTPGAR